MKKCKAMILAMLLVLLASACTVQVEEKIVEKIVEKNVTVSMEKSEYGISFEMEGKQHNFKDTQYLLDGMIYKGSDYMKQWVARNFGDYRGPLANVQVLSGHRSFVVYPLVNEAKDCVSAFAVLYDDVRNLWHIQFYVLDSMNTEWNFMETVQPEQLKIYLYRDDLYISIEGSIGATKKLKDGTTSTVAIKSLFVKSKLLNNSSSDWQVALSQTDYARSELNDATGVSRKQEIELSFYKYLSPGNLMNPFFTDTNYVKGVTAMDKTINFIYVNGEKVFGSWDAAGQIFSYTPTVPYDANSKVEVIVPEQMADVEGAKLNMPYRYSFTTGAKSVGTPKLESATKEYSYGVTLSWKQIDYDKVESYNIYRAESEPGEYVKVATFTPDLTNQFTGNFTYSETTGQEGKSYFYKVTANSAVEGESEMSAAVEGMKVTAPL